VEKQKGSSKKFLSDSMIFPVSTLIYTYQEQTDKRVGCIRMSNHLQTNFHISINVMKFKKKTMEMVQ
jgi:hypothetical protein